MKVVELTRYYTNYGVWGKINLPSPHRGYLYSIEKPWQENQKNISCIPEGRYRCKRYESNTFSNTFKVVNVCGRSHILFHIGNKVSDVKGCIALGKYWDILDNELYVRDSKIAFGEFMEALKEVEEFQLIITGFRAI